MPAVIKTNEDMDLQQQSLMNIESVSAGKTEDKDPELARNESDR